MQQEDDKEFVMYYDEQPNAEPEYRLCGVVVQQPNKDVVDSAHKATREELTLWFEGWLAGWRAHAFLEEYHEDY